MTKVTVETRFIAPAQEVWRLVSGWNALPAWHPAVETSVLEEGGHRRRLKLVDGTEITEQLEEFDGEAQTYTYSIVASSLPLTDYRSNHQRPSRGREVHNRMVDHLQAGRRAGNGADQVSRGVLQAGLR